MKTKTIAIILTIMTILLILTPNVNAVLNSNGSTPTKQILNDWLINIRKIESLGGGLGLTETIKSDLTPSSASNNLDIHMEKNTEYGAMAILSASSYGNPNKIASGGTTTGNQTGIVININKELVAAGNDSYHDYEGFLKSVPNMQNAAGKYKNIYKYSYNYNGMPIEPTVRGDAMKEVQGWHGSGNYWYGDGGYNAGYEWQAAVTRAYSGSIFSYYAKRDTNSNISTSYSVPLYSRAAVVCGEGI